MGKYYYYRSEAERKLVTVLLANYILDNNLTLREGVKGFVGYMLLKPEYKDYPYSLWILSKSTADKYLTNGLRNIDENLAKKMQDHLDKNLQDAPRRGGYATKGKRKKRKKKKDIF